MLQGFERVALATTPTFDWPKMISIVHFFIHYKPITLNSNDRESFEAW